MASVPIEIKMKKKRDATVVALGAAMLFIALIVLGLMVVVAIASPNNHWQVVLNMIPLAFIAGVCITLALYLIGDGSL